MNLSLALQHRARDFFLELFPKFLLDQRLPGWLKLRHFALERRVRSDLSFGLGEPHDFATVTYGDDEVGMARTIALVVVYGESTASLARMEGLVAILLRHSVAPRTPFEGATGLGLLLGRAPD